MFNNMYGFILAASALTAAILQLYSFFAKPTSFLKKRAIEQEQKRIKEVLNETLPPILEARDLTTRDKYRQDRQNYLEEIKGEVETQIKNDFGDTIQEIKDINVKQNETIDVLARSSRDILREKIMAIYHKGKKTKTLMLWEKEALTQYYIDYKAEGGNSYIDKYYSRMIAWAVIDELDE